MLGLKELELSDAVDDDPEKIYYLLRSKTTRNNWHMLVFLAEDGSTRTYTIKDVYPYFYIRNHTASQVQKKIYFHDMDGYVKDIEPVVMKNPMTDEDEKVIKVSVYKPQYCGNKWKPEISVDTVFPREDVHNLIDFYNQVLQEKDYVMGFPYRFVDGVPTFVDDGLDEAHKLYDEVFADLKPEERKVGEHVFRLLHARLPAWDRMIQVGDIEVQANEGDTFDPDKAEVPVSSISFTNAEETRVFVLSNAALRNEQPEDTDQYDDGTFVREVFDSEKNLLRAAMDYAEHKHEEHIGWKVPITLWYNGDRFDIPYLARRLEIHDIKTNLTCFKKDNNYYYKNWDDMYIVDLYQYFYNNNIRNGAYNGMYENLKLDTVAKGIIGEGKYEYEGEIPDMSMEELSFYNAKDTIRTYELATHDNNFPAFILFFIMRIGNLTLENANRRGVTAWWSGFQYRFLEANGYYLPNDDMVFKSNERISGGKVIKAVKGIFRDVSIIDFASLYPTLMIRRNICYSTINCEHDKCAEKPIHIPKMDVDVHICQERRGFMPSALNFFREARVNIYKVKGAEGDEYYKNLAQFIKIFMNASFGALKNPGFDFAHVHAAELITTLGRKSLMKLKKLIEKNGGNVLYGDSVTGDQAVIVRMGDEGMPKVLSIEEIWHMTTDDGFEPTGSLQEKEYLVTPDLQIWNGTRFTPVRRMIRHAVAKSIYRVATGKGVVDVTEDHSLVDEEGREFKPQMIARGRSPYSEFFDLSDRPIAPIDQRDKIKLLFLFSMNGTASGTSTGFKSQRTVALTFHPRLINRGTDLFNEIAPLTDHLGANHKIYETSRDKMLVKFSAHQELWNLVRSHLYVGDTKLKPYPQVFALPDDELYQCYLYLKDYYRKDIDEYELYVIESMTELVVFSAMANYFGDEFVYTPQRRRNKYNVRRRSDDYDYKDVVTVLTSLTPIVYDFETADGTFMAGNILCHNTDSVFVQGDVTISDEEMSEKLKLDVDTEDFFEMFIQHKKKNYLKIRKDGSVTVKGMVGKKRNVPKLARRAFQNAVSSLRWDMTESEVEDVFGKALLECEEKIKERDFLLSDLAVTQSLSKDLNRYKSNTPLVRAIKNKRQNMKSKGDSRYRTFGRKGTIVDYVRAKNTWMPVELITKDDIDIDYYIDNLDGVFSQLIEPLGLTVKQLREKIKYGSLDQWF